MFALEIITQNLISKTGKIATSNRKHMLWVLKSTKLCKNKLKIVKLNYLKIRI